MTHPQPLDPTLPLPPPITSTPLPANPGIHLQIRPYHPLDAPFLATQANNPKIASVNRNRFPHPYSLADAEYWIRRVSEGGEGYGEGAYFGIFLKSQRGQALLEDEDPARGLLIGGCGLDMGKDVFCRGAEVGYWLGERFWGKGYATLMLRDLVGWAFSREGGIVGGGERLLRVEAGVFGGNEASLRVLEKVGFRKEGVLKGAVWKKGECRDYHILGLLRENGRGQWEDDRCMRYPY